MSDPEKSSESLNSKSMQELFEALKKELQAGAEQQKRVQVSQLQGQTQSSPLVTSQVQNPTPASSALTDAEKLKKALELAAKAALEEAQKQEEAKKQSSAQASSTASVSPGQAQGQANGVQLSTNLAQAANQGKAKAVINVAKYIAENVAGILQESPSSSPFPPPPPTPPPLGPPPPNPPPPSPSPPHPPTNQEYQENIVDGFPVVTERTPVQGPLVTGILASQTSTQTSLGSQANLQKKPAPENYSPPILNMNPSSTQKDIEKLNTLLKNLKTGELEKFRKLLIDKQNKIPSILKNIENNLIENIRSIDNPNAQKGGAPDAITKASNERAKTKKYIKTIDQLSSLLQENFNINKRFFIEDNKSLIREFLKIKERIEAQNSSGISSTGEMNKLITLIEKTGNPALLQIVKGTKDTIINNLKTQLNQVTDQNQKDAILNQIAAYDFASRSSDQILQKLTEVNNAFDAKIQEISNLNNTFSNNLKNSTIINSIRSVNLEDPEYIKKIENAIKDFEEDADQKDQKLKSLYYLNYSIMDLTMDSQFYVLYVIKGLRILFAYVSLFLATRIFTPMYEGAVYDKQQNPPSLQWYTMIYLSLDAAFNVFLFVLLYLIRALFSTSGDFVIDSYLFKKYITDYLISTFLLMAISNLIAVVITKKKYFRYQYEGSRTIRAFEQIMFFTAIVLYVFPFFWVL